MRLRPTPASLLAATALFVALGGSAVAFSEAAQPRCKNGAVRGIAAVSGGQSGMENIPGAFTNRKALFSRTFNCTGGGVQVRRLSLGAYEVRFPGNAAGSALVSATDALASVQPVAGGAFKVVVHSPGLIDPFDAPFVVVVI